MKQGFSSGGGIAGERGTQGPGPQNEDARNASSLDARNTGYAMWWTKNARHVRACGM